MKYYIIAGEASGDLHGSNLIKALKNIDPQARFRVWGGDKMQFAGGDLVRHYRHHAFMGLIPVIRNFNTIRKNFQFAEEDILKYQPDALILIDYSGFNLTVAKRVYNKGFKIFYYISPQVWAWRKSRVFKIKKYIDRMYTILPFEPSFYAQFDVDVDYVGHPLLDAIHDFKREFSLTRAEFIRHHNLTDKPIIALLPGSRKQEVSAMLPVMLEASRNFHNHQFIIAGTSSQDPGFYEQYLHQDKLTVLYDQTYPLLYFAQAALVTSGTATLETALFKVPQVVCYRAGTLSYYIVKSLVHIRYISTVNLIMDQPVVEELIQQHLTPEKCARSLNKLLTDDDHRERQKKLYGALEDKLEGPGASIRAAEGMYRILTSE